jgi:hypothetical protein
MIFMAGKCLAAQRGFTIFILLCVRLIIFIVLLKDLDIFEFEIELILLLLITLSLSLNKTLAFSVLLVSAAVIGITVVTGMVAPVTFGRV